MNKTGLVLKVEKNTAVLVTNTGEFVKVSASENIPKIGETYTGRMKKDHSYIKHLAAASLFFFIFLCSGGVFAYYTPAATIQVNINPSIELKTNIFDRIIEASPNNSDGKTLLGNLKLKNKNINEALILVVEQSEKYKFINDKYITAGKTISVNVSAKIKLKAIKLDKFQNYISEKKINTIINNNGKEHDQEFNKIDKNTHEKLPLDNKKDNNTPVKKEDKNINNNYKPIEDTNKKKNNEGSKNNNLNQKKDIKQNNNNSYKQNNKNNINNKNIENKKNDNYKKSEYDEKKNYEQKNQPSKQH